MIMSAAGPALDDLFLRRLKRIDNRLDMLWSKGPERWLMVYDKGNNNLVNMFLIETEDHQYRHPDHRDLVRIKAADLVAKDAVARYREAAQYMVDVRQADRKRAKDNIRNMTVDDRIQLMQAFSKLAGSGKGNSAFRRIQAKARGQIY
ncbi:MAG: hypothetical protein ABID54_04855 [Pseudomonadota bacterium]